MGVAGCASQFFDVAEEVPLDVEVFSFKFIDSRVRDIRLVVTKDVGIWLHPCQTSDWLVFQGDPLHVLMQLFYTGISL